MKALTGESSGRKSRKRKVFYQCNTSSPFYKDVKDYVGRNDFKDKK